MPDWTQLSGLLNFCAVYYTTQLVRCAAFSFLMIGFVMLLRKFFFSKRTFLRGMLWASFLVIPFLGRLKLFYENTAVRNVTGWMTVGTMSCLWADRVYMAGILVSAVCIFGKRLRIRCAVSEMEKTTFENIYIYMTDMNVSPFTVGLLKPKIVLPKVMADRYGREELRTVIRHEQTHIRLGHLWCGFVWDLLRCLLWINPLLTIFQKYFRADLEDICDRVRIQNSGKTAWEYGLELLKSLMLLRSGQGDVPSVMTYAGEKEFADMKRRMEQIAGFRPYRKRICWSMAAGTFLAVAAALLVIQAHSYGRYNESRDILVGKK